MDPVLQPQPNLAPPEKLMDRGCKDENSVRSIRQPVILLFRSGQFSAVAQVLSDHEEATSSLGFIPNMSLCLPGQRRGKIQAICSRLEPVVAARRRGDQEPLAASS